MSLRAFFRVPGYPLFSVNALKKVFLFCAESLHVESGGGILMTDENIKLKADKRGQVLVLDCLNDLFTEVAIDSNIRPVSIAAVVTYNDGSTNQQFAGNLDRILTIGALHDLALQIFLHCKQHETEKQIKKAVEELHLASLPTGGAKPN